MTKNAEKKPVVKKKIQQETEVVRFDWAIKYFLRNKANFDVLEGFLSELLKLDIKIDKLLESEVSPTDKHTKLSRMDLLADTNLGKVIIEVQVERQYDFLSRILYSASKAVTDYMKKGDDYFNVQKVYSVSVLYFELGHGSDYLYKGQTEFKGIHTQDILTLNQKEKDIYQHPVNCPSDIFPEYYLVKVNQFRNSISEKLDEWMYFFKNEKIKPEFTAKGIQVAAEKLAIVKMTPEKRASYESYLKDLSYEASMLNTRFSEGKMEGKIEGEAIGLEKGHAKGEHEKALAIGKNLKARGLSNQEISDITGLSLNETEKL